MRSGVLADPIRSCSFENCRQCRSSQQYRSGKKAFPVSGILRPGEKLVAGVAGVPDSGNQAICGIPARVEGAVALLRQESVISKIGFEKRDIQLFPQPGKSMSPWCRRQDLNLHWHNPNQDLNLKPLRSYTTTRRAAQRPMVTPAPPSRSRRVAAIVRAGGCQ